MAEGELHYHGLVASTYDLLLPEDELGDAAFFRQAIQADGQPALEIGCGSGRLLIPYRAAGLEVEGVDSSTEMLAICRRKAAARDLNASLYLQAMQTLELPRRYRLIYVPAATFMLLTKSSDIEHTLGCFCRHLESGGRVLIPLFLPWREDLRGMPPPPPGEWRLRRQALRPEDGKTIRCWDQAEPDFTRQTVHGRLRYEILNGERVEQTEEHSVTLRWHTQEQFSELLRRAGCQEIQALRAHTFDPARPEDPVFTFSARR